MTDTTTDLRPQHLEALDRAKRFRSRWPAIRAAVATGDLPLDVVLRGELEGDDVDVVAGKSIEDVLRAGRRVGRSVAGKVLKHADTPPIRPDKKVGALTARQIAAVIDVLRSVAPWTLSDEAQR